MSISPSLTFKFIESAAVVSCPASRLLTLLFAPPEINGGDTSEKEGIKVYSFYLDTVTSAV